MNEILEAFSVEKDSLLLEITSVNNGKEKLQEEYKSILTEMGEVLLFTLTILLWSFNFILLILMM